MIVPLVLLAFAAAASTELPPFENPCANGYTENVWDPRFAPGQQWSYHNRPIDEGSTFIITKIDDVPGIGIVIQIDVLDVDIIDEPGISRPHNNGYRLSLAMRRDTLDASALQMLRIVQTVGPPSGEYQRWKKNCGGLTYATSIADSIQAEHEAYLARLRTQTRIFTVARISSGHRETFKVSLTKETQFHTISGYVTTKDGTPVKDAVIELQVQGSSDWRPQNLSTPQNPPHIKSAADGSFQLPRLGTSFIYSFKLTLDGFHPIQATLQDLPDGYLNFVPIR
jgi:hypothetical protein